MDTIKSLAVITLLGAVLYGVYVVASKPEKVLSPEMQQLSEAAENGPLIDDGRGSSSSSSRKKPARAASSKASANDDYRRDYEVNGATNLDDAETDDADSHYRKRPPPLDSDDFTPNTLRGDHESSPKAKPLIRPKLTPPEPRTRLPQEPGDEASPKNSRLENDDFSPIPKNDDFNTETPNRGTPKPEDKNSLNSAPPSTANPADIEAARQRVALYAFRQTWKTAQEQVDDGHYREALLALSAFYNEEGLPEKEREELIGWLDALAAKVVYSTENLLEQPYITRKNESLYDISNKYGVTYLLLKNINGVRDPELLIPGTKLKVIRGPFRAEVDLRRHEITAFVDNLYAGRFPFTLGDVPVPPGEYIVEKKEPAKYYASAQGKIDAKDPRNPYGGLYMDLGRGVFIHGTASEAYVDPKFGCISLAPRDAEDLFAILSTLESKVLVRP